MVSVQEKDALDAVFVHSAGQLPVEPIEVRGYDFNEGVDYHRLLLSYKTSGFQATNFGLAVEEVNKMLAKKKEDMDKDDLPDINLNPCGRPLSNCTIFLGYTSNMASCGVRDSIRFLAQHNMVDCICTSAGGVEEDLIKCLAPTYLGDFHKFQGKELRKQGINRIGNLLVPNDNYCKFENWIKPILETMLDEQETQSAKWTPSKFIQRLGKEINDPSSIYYWCSKNNIPVFCPALTDGSIGDMLYFFNINRPGLLLDLVEDIHRMNSQAVFAKHTGMIIVGGGVMKHHICNANLMRNGANFSVFINTASEYDGSDSGARPDEAVSWGKIKLDAHPVKVYGEASLIFPLLVGETFARHHHEAQKQQGHL